MGSHLLLQMLIPPWRAGRAPWSSGWRVGAVSPPGPAQQAPGRPGYKATPRQLGTESQAPAGAAALCSLHHFPAPVSRRGQCTTRPGVGTGLCQPGEGASVLGRVCWDREGPARVAGQQKPLRQRLGGRGGGWPSRGHLAVSAASGPEGTLLASGREARMLLSIPQCTGQHHPQMSIWLQKSTVSRLSICRQAHHRGGSSDRDPSPLRAGALPGTARARRALPAARARADGETELGGQTQHLEREMLREDEGTQAAVRTQARQSGGTRVMRTGRPAASSRCLPPGAGGGSRGRSGTSDTWKGLIPVMQGLCVDLGRR